MEEGRRGYFCFCYWDFMYAAEASRPTQVRSSMWHHGARRMTAARAPARDRTRTAAPSSSIQCRTADGRD